MRGRLVLLAAGCGFALSLQGCDSCGPDGRRFTAEGQVPRPGGEEGFRFELNLSELRSGVNPQLWTRIVDLGDPVLDGHVTAAHLLDARDDTVFVFVVSNFDDRSNIHTGPGIITLPEADRIRDELLGAGLRVDVRSTLEGREHFIFAVPLIQAGDWERASCLISG